MLNSNGIKTVLIETVDRLARDLMVQEPIRADLKRAGSDRCVLHDVAKPIVGERLVKRVQNPICWRYQFQRFLVRLLYNI